MNTRIAKIFISLLCTFFGFVAGILYEIFFPDPSWARSNYGKFITDLAICTGIVIFIWWLIFFIPLLFIKKFNFFKSPYSLMWGIVFGLFGGFIMSVVVFGGNWKYEGVLFSQNCLWMWIHAAIVGGLSFYLYGECLGFSKVENNKGRQNESSIRYTAVESCGSD